jgi:hypothetical protein
MIKLNKYSYAFFVGMALVLASCGNSIENETSNSIHEERNHDDESIELDNGEKWKVMDEMMGHIRNMESDVIAFENQEEKDYQSLAIRLIDNIDLLTANCTMTGQAHDELHKWLLPYIDIVGELAEAKNNEAAVETYQKIQVSFKTFNAYFN